MKENLISVNGHIWISCFCEIPDLQIWHFVEIPDLQTWNFVVFVCVSLCLCLSVSVRVCLCMSGSACVFSLAVGARSTVADGQTCGTDHLASTQQNVGEGGE